MRGVIGAVIVTLLCAVSPVSAQCPPGVDCSAGLSRGLSYQGPLVSGGLSFGRPMVRSYAVVPSYFPQYAPRYVPRYVPAASYYRPAWSSYGTAYSGGSAGSYGASSAVCPNCGKVRAFSGYGSAGG